MPGRCLLVVAKTEEEMSPAPAAALLCWVAFRRASSLVAGFGAGVAAFKGLVWVISINIASCFG